MSVFRCTYLDAELVVCGGIVKFSPCDYGEDVAVFQIWQQLQVPGLLFSQGEAQVLRGSEENIRNNVKNNCQDIKLNVDAIQQKLG